MTSIRWRAVALALGSAAGMWGQSQFWGELKAGKYAVGFRSLYQLDVARSYDADYPATGRPPPTSSTFRCSSRKAATS